MKENMSVTVKGYSNDKFLGSGEIGAVHYTRTTTSIRRHANQENRKQDPESRRNTKLFNVGVLILLIPFYLVHKLY